MKKRIWIITGLALAVFILTTGILLVKRKIWFVSPNENIYQVRGLDISHHQGEIDWDRVDPEYRFVFVKATEGDTFRDKRFLENIEGIKRTNRIAGAYHFFHFNYSGIEQADNFIRTVGDLIQLPPVVDFEYSGNPSEYDREILIRELRACIERLETHYCRRAIIYTTPTAYRQIIQGHFDSPLWYRSIILPVKRNMKNLVFWQYHNSAVIEGVNTIVDLNVFKGTLEELRAMVTD